LVGRADELAVLEGAFERTLEGRGGIVGVVADAGVGKSRLCSEFVERARARGVAVYEAHCPSHGRVVPLLPILQMFRDFFGITQTDGDQLAREKIAGRMLLLDRELEPFLPLAFEFLCVPDPNNPAPEMEPPVRQRQLIAFTRRLVQARSVREPAVLFFDDAHWVDDSSDAFIAQVADVVPGTRTMLLLNFRPEYAAEWMDRASYQPLPLRPLGDEAVDALLADLLGSDPSLAPLRTLMRERTGGNPFFIEEIVHALADAGSLVGQRGGYRLDAPLERLEIPPTVHGILAARIDRLPERDKSVLQTAAAIGLRFSDTLLRRVCGLAGEELDAALAELRRLELIHEEALYPEVEYAFRHPLTHEVAERSQLAAHRRRLHVSVARALEGLHAEKPDENAALLAHHWDLGGEAEPAARWHRRAAEWIAGGHAPEALRHWNRVRELADRISDPALARELGQRARVMVLEYGWRIGLSADEANELLSEGEQWARRHDDSHALAAIYNAFAIPCAFSLDQSPRARELAATGLRLAEEAGDGALACALELRMFFVANAMGLVPAMFEAMDALAHRSHDEMEGASPLVGYDVPVAIVGWRGFPHLLSGELDTALLHLHRGIELGRTRNTAEALGWLLQMESMLWCERGEAARAGATARQALEIAERIESPISQAMALNSLGRVLALEGSADAAVTTLERALAITERVLRHVSPEISSYIARIHCSVGALSEAQTAAARALALAEARHAHGGEVLALHALASVAVAAGGDAEIAKAQRLLDRAESRAAEIGYGVIQPHLCELRAHIAQRSGLTSAATAALRRARDLFDQMGAPLQVDRLAKTGLG
jgi:adenylate cyclase